MTATKVSLNVDLDKLKAEKRLTAKRCCVEGCEKTGDWNNKDRNFYLVKGMCHMHYSRYLKNGDPKLVSVLYNNRSNHPLYRTYNMMMQRCYNKLNTNYKTYGKRGIGVCEDWKDPVNGAFQFYKDMGDRPIGTTLDRKENHLGYSKENCRWATKHQQNSNTCRNNKVVGVYYDKKIDRYLSQILISGKRFKKLFKTEQEAIDQRKSWEIEFGIVY